MWCFCHDQWINNIAHQLQYSQSFELDWLLDYRLSLHICAVFYPCSGTSHGPVSVCLCLCFCHKSEVCRNGWTNRAGFWHVSFLPPILVAVSTAWFRRAGQLATLDTCTVCSSLQYLLFSNCTWMKLGLLCHFASMCIHISGLRLQDIICRHEFCAFNHLYV